MSNSISNKMIAIDLFGLLGVVTLIVLKLTNMIDWSWWWVTLPLWGSATIVLVMLLIMGIIEMVSKNLHQL